MIPFVELKSQYLALQPEINQAIAEVFADSNFILGPRVVRFEEQFAAYCHANHAIAVNSGTSALHLALLAAGVGPGDEVITVSLTFIATAAAVVYCGAKPVFVDVDPNTGNLDPRQLEKAITPRTKVIMPVHLHGLMADMDAIMEIANQYNLLVIEDACQAHGAKIRDKMAGSIGKINAFSFYPTKNLGAYGEGGAVVTNDEALAKQMRLLRDAGSVEKYKHQAKGFNYRMESLQGAILSVKLKYLEEWIEKRRQVANWYIERLQHSPHIQLPQFPATFRHVYHVFSIRIKNRDQVQKELLQRGVMTSVHYPIPVHLQEGYRDLGHGLGSLPVSEQLANEFLSLPLYPELTEAQVDYICTQLQQIVAGSQTMHAL